MKKKKGFTLVELLTVIIVLGILVAVSFPIVRNVIKGSKQKAYNTTIQNIKTSALSYSTEFFDDIRWYVATEGNKESNEEWTCVEINRLIEKGHLKDIRKNGDVVAEDPETGTQIVGSHFIELRRDKVTHGLSRDQVTFDSDNCNGGYDNTDPTLSIVLTFEDGTSYNSSWTDKNVVQKITAYDANGIRELKIKYSDDDEYHDISPVTKTDTKWTAKLVQSNEINGNNISVKTTDYFGHEIEKGYMIFIDKTDPTCDIKATGTKANNSNEWWISNVKLELQTNDMSTVQYDFSKSNTVTYNNVTKVLTQVENTVGTTYYAHVKDQAGHTNECQITIKKDDVKPTAPSLAAYPTSFTKNKSTPSTLPPTGAKYGVAGGITSCTCNGNACTNLNNVANGSTSIVCVARGNNGLESSVNKTITISSCRPKTSCNMCGSPESDGCGGTITCPVCPTVAPTPVPTTCECTLGTSFNYCRSMYGRGYSCDGCRCVSTTTPTTTPTTDDDCCGAYSCDSNEYCATDCECHIRRDDPPITPTIPPTTPPTTPKPTTPRPTKCPDDMIETIDGGCCSKPGAGIDCEM